MAELHPPISAYIRTQNEERMIEEVIKAALTLVREVIVIDSGSTDRTIEIARAAGARVRHQDWLGNGKQKRAAEDIALHDWVLDLDADEVITPEFAKEVKALFASGEPFQDAFYTPLVNVPPVGTPWYGYGQAERHKLYNKTRIRIPDHEAWDQFKVSGRVRTGKLKGAILHYAFDGTDLLIQKLNKNSSTRARLLKPKSLPYLTVRIIFGLPIYFSKRYFINGLWRGGVYGFAFSLMSGFGRWMRDIKMYERVMKEKGNTLYVDKDNQSE